MFAVLAALVVVQVFLDLRIPEYMSDITDSIQMGLPTDVIADAGIGMVACAFASLLCAMTCGVLGARIASSLAMTLRAKQFERVMGLSSADISEFSIPTLVTRSTNDVYQLQQFLARTMFIVVKAPVTAVWATTKIAGGSLEWTTVTAVTVVTLAIIMSIVLRLSIPYFKKVQWLTDGVNHHTRENLEGVRVIRAYNAEERQTAALIAASDDVLANNKKVEAIMAPLHPLAGSMLNFLTIAIYWIGAGIITSAGTQAEQMLIFSDMIVYSTYAGHVIVSVMMITGLFRGLPSMIVSARRIEAVINMQPSVTDGDARDVPSTGSVEFRNVSFRYPGSESDAISGISFKAEPGQTVAVVGPTGSGKSSLAALIPRLYDATSGEVLVDGVDVRDFAQKDLRSRIGFVPQSAVIFTGTVRSNVAYGNPDATDEDVRRALSVAQAEFVDSMEDGMDSMISKHGRNISGGQKQRICIARAICKDPRIFVFDDSFSALDYKTDRELRSALKKEAAGRTSIIVAQRIGTVMDADRIIVLDRGRVIGDGTHAELMEACPLYRDMAESQLGGDSRWRMRGRSGPGATSPRTFGARSPSCSATPGRSGTACCCPYPWRCSAPSSRCSAPSTCRTSRTRYLMPYRTPGPSTRT